MKSRVVHGWCIVAVMLTAVPAVAQLDSSRATGSVGDAGAMTIPDTAFRTAFLSMNRSVNAFFWTINSGVAGAAAGGKYIFTERMAATLIPETGQQAAERTNTDLRLGLAYPFAQGWNVTATSSAQTLVDNQNIGINNIARVGAMAGIDARVADVVRFAGEGGTLFDRQIGIQNSGPQYAAQVQLTPLVVNEYTVWGNAESAQEYLSPRRNASHNVVLNAAIASPTADVHVRLDALNTERDFYFPDSTGAQFTGEAYNIERRKETGLHGALQGTYQVADGWQMRFDGDASNRFITHQDAYKTAQLPSAHIDSRIQEFRLAAAGTMIGDVFGVQTNVSLHYEDYEETHGVDPSPENSATALTQQETVESQKNSIVHRTQIGAGLGIPAGRVDTVALSTSLSMLRYDTPDTSNTDDRDELGMAFHTAYSTRMFPGTTWGIRADLFLHHLVYLFSAQSGNNGWNRIVRLSPFVTIAPSPAFRTMASFDVLGNYTVFDFESVLQSVHSYSFRQLTLNDSTEWEIAPSYRATAFINLKWYEHGQLDYAAFRERPIDLVREWTYGAALQQRVSMSLTVASGIRVFMRNVFAYGGGGVYAPTTNVRAIGPTVIGTWIVERMGTLTVDGWYEILTETNNAARTIPNFLMSVKWNL